jgi:hypothetical protein
MNKTSKKYWYLMIFYIIIVVFQILYTKYKLQLKIKKEIDNKIEFNKEHYDEVSIFLQNDLTKRVSLLTSGKMEYKEWVIFMNEENKIKYKGQSYYYFSWERGKQPNPIVSTYTATVHANKKFINMNWDDIFKENNEFFVFVKQTIDPNLIKRFFELGRPKNQPIKYYWVDPINVIPVQKTSFVDKIELDGGTNSIVVGIGIDIANLHEEETINYSKYIHTSHITLISILTFVVSLIILIYSDEKYSYKSYLFLILSNIYVVYFFNTTEYNGTPDTEIKKIDDINNGLLGISFLVGVNTYILSQFTKDIHKELFSQSALIFAISIILLLIASFKITDSITVKELIEDRISTQFVFNFSVLLNIVMVSNYLFFVLYNKVKL